MGRRGGKGWREISNFFFFHCRFQLLIKNQKQTLTILAHSDERFLMKTETVHREQKLKKIVNNEVNQLSNQI